MMKVGEKKLVAERQKMVERKKKGSQLQARAGGIIVGLPQ
jgi:hypothetical protein